MAKGKSPIKLKRTDIRRLGPAIGIFLAVAAIVLLLLQVSPKLALAAAALAILTPFVAMIYFFSKLGK